MNAMAEEIATIAGGCFWCVEPLYRDLAGVTAVESGYTGGHVADPGYERVCGGDTGHAEAVRITFDPAILPYDDLLDIFFHIHDPTQLNRQGADVGTQYRSAIFPHSPEQEAAARAAVARAQTESVRPIVTTIEPFGRWYPAEGYHQDYYARNGSTNGYCVAVIAPKLRKFHKAYAGRLKAGAGARAS
jgi:peptide-methionine (S)-S-oxide reductase